ncbi:MAG: PilN domain-containing protein [Phycisphaerae bacterium]|nr:PilN domain-containing protein [Phycisphaerae bacterium]
MSLVSLLPEDYVAHKRQKRANLMCLLLFGIVMVGLVAAAVVSERKHGRTREVCKKVDESYEEAGKLIQQMRELDVTRHKMLQKANRTAALLERVPRSYLLATITNALPKGASLTEFKLRTKIPKSPNTSGKKKTKFGKVAAAKKESVPEAEKKMKIEITVTGLAGTDVEVGTFISTMGQCPLIKSVELVFSKKTKVEECVMREFKVVLQMKDDADVRNQPVADEAVSDTGDTNKKESS